MHINNDGLNRLTHSQVTNPQATNPSLALTYDMMGNIQSKSGTGTYSYGDASHPYAVTAITDAGGNTIYSASYDADGNMLAGASRGISWNVDQWGHP